MRKTIMYFGLIVFLILSACGGEDEQDTQNTEKETEEETPEQDDMKDEPAEEEPQQQDKEADAPAEDEPVVEEGSTWDDIKEKDKITGVSDKDFSEVTKSKPGEVRNDSTGNWRITKISENIDIEEYALSYADLNMKDDEVHFIVNFNYHTTTWLSKMNGLLYVDILEYVDKEEHDASTLGSGMLLKGYVIYPDGDIQELEE